MPYRHKLRIRFYDDRPESPVFLEIKRRITDVIRKERAAISREGVGRLLAGGRPDGSYLVPGNDEERGNAPALWGVGNARSVSWSLPATLALSAICYGCRRLAICVLSTASKIDCFSPDGPENQACDPPSRPTHPSWKGPP